MRLISQDGMIDIPYEISGLSTGRMGESATIYVRSKLLDEKPCVFATYSTEAKALKVMELLREQYQKLEIAKVIGCGGAERISKDATQTVAEIIISEFWKAHTFIFPKDEEVEV